MDDRDLDLLRAFRADPALTTPPEGLQARIEENLWQAILAEESARAGGARARARRSWFSAYVRPAVALGAAASIAVVVAFASDGSVGSGTQTGTQVTRAGTGLVNATATALFGGVPATSSVPPTAAQVAPTGASTEPQLDESTIGYVRAAARDPRRIRTLLLENSDSTDPAERDRIAFHAAMKWVVAPQVPGDVRAAMLKSLSDLEGLDQVVSAVDSLGRTSVLIGHLDAVSGLREQYLLDPDHGLLLERRAFTTSYIDPACPPGTFTDFELFDPPGSATSPERTPWLAWPAVISACLPVSDVNQ